MRFEKLLIQRRGLEQYKNHNDTELLQELITEYNQYKANSALKKWQLNEDAQKAIWSVIIGLDEESRQLLRSHLNHNKWEQSGVLAVSCALVLAMRLQ